MKEKWPVLEFFADSLVSGTLSHLMATHSHVQSVTAPAPWDGGYFKDRVCLMNLKCEEKQEAKVGEDNQLVIFFWVLFFDEHG